MAPTVQDTSASSRSVYRPHSRRPPTILELADRARELHWDPALTLKHWLKSAEKHRNAGNELVAKGEFELGFVELARAATIVMEKVPTHKDYNSVLNPEHRKNLGAVSHNFAYLPFIYLPHVQVSCSSCHFRMDKISWIN